MRIWSQKKPKGMSSSLPYPTTYLLLPSKWQLDNWHSTAAVSHR